MFASAALLLTVLAAQFGPAGATTTDFGRADSARAVAVQPDGRLVVAGSSSSPNQDVYLPAVSRYLEDGALDPSFGGDGTVTTELGSFAGANDVLVQTDGRIVAVGAAGDDDHGGLGAVRYLPDGALDPSFGGGDGLVVARSGRGG